MGGVSSRLDDGPALFLRDQNRFSVAGLTITDSRNRTLYNISPNAYPATRYAARREAGDDTPIDFVQDPGSTITGAPPPFILRLSNEEDLIFNFTCVVRQQNASAYSQDPQLIHSDPSADTQLAGLTYIFASNAKEIDQLVTREFNADPNLHRNPNVQLVGDYTTAGSPSVQFNWTWRWRAPKQGEDRGGGWRNCCSFVDYDQRAHKLNTLASFSFWVQNSQRYLNSPISRSPRLDLISPPRLRVPSAQSIESRFSALSDSDGANDYNLLTHPQSPLIEPIPEYGLGLVPSMASSNGAGAGNTKTIDVSCVKGPGVDLSTTEDGPLFRATMKDLEKRTGSMRSRMKKVLRTAEAAESAQTACNDAVSNFMEALRDASSSNANAVGPALAHYFEKIAKEILLYEKQNAINLQKLVIDPLSRLYTVDIKQADSKKRDFEEESKDYYSYVGKYLGQRTESLKEKKRIESDSKYQAKRKTFELKRFDYSSFMHDLSGGRKDQEVLSQLTKYADAQAKGFLRTAKKVDDMIPQLETLCLEVDQVDKDFQLQRTEREEKRRNLEKHRSADLEANTNGSRPDSESGRLQQRNSMLGTSPPNFSSFATTSLASTLSPITSSSEQSALPVRTPSSKFRGIRDLEEKDAFTSAASDTSIIRKEGLLWSLSRPGSHVDPKGLTKTAWHKFWIVLDQGKLAEYVNWKDGLDRRMEPIDLRMASVREARNSERRFCFEVITPHFTRVYQAPSEDDMKSWIASINNALQSAFEARTSTSAPVSEASAHSKSKDIAAVLTGKSSSFSGHRAISGASAAANAAKAVSRHATTGDRPVYRRADSAEAHPSALLNQIREADEGNKYCVDCGSEAKVEWVSINLGIVLCIECSGIHRSLGTHISKIRSLTLDTAAFTPDIIDLLLLIGNRVSNMVWEAKLDVFLKPAPHSTRDQRLSFITAKYVERAYVQPIAANRQSHYATPDETLLASIKKNDVQNVLYALALRANPNTLDRSRACHPIFLALAAADPAAPGTAAVSSQAGRAPAFGASSHAYQASSGFSHTAASTGYAHDATSSTLTALPAQSQLSRPPSPVPRKPFPVAELLLQNGAEIPVQLAPIPLSRPATAYLDFKTEQRLGRHLGVGVKDGHGDALGQLPGIAGTGSAGGGGSSLSSGAAPPGLPKRNSAGFVGGVKVLGEGAASTGVGAGFGGGKR